LTIGSTWWATTKYALKWYLRHKIYNKAITEKVSFNYFCQISNRSWFSVYSIFCEKPSYQSDRKSYFKKCCQVSDCFTLVLSESSHPSIYITRDNANYNIKYSPKVLERTIVTDYKIFAKVNLIWLLLGFLIQLESLATFSYFSLFQFISSTW